MEANIVPKIPPIKLRNRVKDHFHYEHIYQSICEEIRKIPEVEKNFKLNPEITLIVCLVVENMVGKEMKIDKKALVIKALSEVFNLNEEEKVQTEDQIEFLFNNGDIKKIHVPKLKKAAKWVKSFFFQRK